MMAPGGFQVAAIPSSAYILRALACVCSISVSLCCGVVLACDYVLLGQGTDGA